MENLNKSWFCSMCGFKLDNNESYNQEQDDAPIIGDNIKIHLVSI